MPCVGGGGVFPSFCGRDNAKIAKNKLSKTQVKLKYLASIVIKSKDGFLSSANGYFTLTPPLVFNIIPQTATNNQSINKYKHLGFAKVLPRNKKNIQAANADKHSKTNKTQGKYLLILFIFTSGFIFLFLITC